MAKADNKPEIETEAVEPQTDSDATETSSEYSEAEQLQGQLQEQQERVLRIQAEMENMRKRSQKQIQDAHKFALEKFAAELLNTVDSMERGLESTAAEGEAKLLHEGMELTCKMLLDTLAKFGVETINDVATPFDPSIHEAVSMQEDPKAKPNHVIMVVQKGYRLNDRLLRPARVIVAKAQTKKVDEQA